MFFKSVGKLFGMVVKQFMIKSGQTSSWSNSTGDEGEFSMAEVFQAQTMYSQPVLRGRIFHSQSTDDLGDCSSCQCRVESYWMI